MKEAALLDLVLSATLLATVVGVRTAYSAWVPHPAGGWLGRLHSPDKSSLLGRGLIEATYWAITPLARTLALDGVSANAITIASLVFGSAAGMALAAGHFGIGAWFGASSALCDALDGLVARESGTASRAGEAFDASADRYNEFLFLTGLALYFRSNAWMLAVVLLALHGSFMVSFAETKAESLQVMVPRGWMRRSDRATLLIAGAALSAIGAGLGASRVVVLFPLLVALLVDSIGANASAARRLIKVITQLDVEERRSDPGRVRVDIHPRSEARS
jgi:phosphatidylglycerophosphate synthase